MRIWIFILSLLICTSAIAQERTVSGTVKDEQGEPIIGANVSPIGAERAGTVGTASGLDGEFVLKVSSTDTALRISAVGYEDTLILIKNTAKIEVVLIEEIFCVLEIVETSCFCDPSRFDIGSIVDARVKNNYSFASPAQNMTLYAAGVLAQQNAGQPGSLTNILIRGLGNTLGQNQPLYVLDGIPVRGHDLSWIQPNDIESIEILKDAPASLFYTSRSSNGVVLLQSKRGREGKAEYHYSLQYGWESQVENGLELMDANQKDLYENLYGLYPDERPEIADYGWQDAAYQVGKHLQHTLTATGGNEKSRFYWSGSYLKKDGSIANTGFERYASWLNLDYRVTEKTKLLTTIGGAMTQNELMPYRGMNLSNPLIAHLVNPFTPISTPDVARPNTRLGIHPQEEQNRQRHTREDFRLFGKVELNTKLTADLNFSTRTGLEMGRRGFTSIYSNGSFVSDQFENGMMGEGNVGFTDISNYTTLTYDKTIDEDHWITLGAWSEITNAQYLATQATGYDVMETDGTVQPKTIFSNSRQRRKNGLTNINFAGQYSFKDKYILRGSFARSNLMQDGYQTFSDNFWSIGAAWNIDYERWFDNSALYFITQLKLRASHGVQGNLGLWADPLPLLTQPQTAIAPDPIFPNHEWANTIASPSKQEMTNLGLDFGFLRRRISGSVDLYRRQTRSVFEPEGERTIMPVIKNRGIEIDMTFHVVRRRRFDLQLFVNYTFNQNQVLEIANGTTVYDGITTLAEGSPAYVFNLIRYAGVDQATGQALYADDSGGTTTDPNKAAKQVLGQSIPPQYGGIGQRVFIHLPSNTGRIDFEVFFSVIRGSKRFNNVRYFTENPAFHHLNQSPVMLGAWQQLGNMTDIPKVEGGYLPISDRFLDDASYMRLRHISLGYTLPEALTQKIKLDRVHIYAQGQNLWTWTSFTGLEVEGFDPVSTLSYPIPKRFSLGIEISW
jgi:TonB-linked SusC/RagA family outer membrane protein